MRSAAGDVTLENPFVGGATSAKKLDAKAIASQKRAAAAHQLFIKASGATAATE